MHYSYSRLSVYEDCPYRFNQIYNLKQKEPVSDILMVGKICHDIIKEYSNHLRTTKQSTDFESILKITDECIAKERRYDLADEITAIINKFSKSFMIHADTIYDIEHKFGLNRDLTPIGWPAGPEGWNHIFFTGIIDRIDLLSDEHIKITDYKSGWNTDVDKFQPRLYALALSRIFPSAQKFVIELDFIRFGIQKEFTITVEDIIKIKDKLFKLAEEIESISEWEWEPRPGDACKWCGFLDSCPALKMIQNNPFKGNILKEDQARIAAEAILLLTAQLDANRKALQKWVKVQGPVLHNGYQFGYSVKESDEITEIAELFHVLEGKADLDKYFTVAAANRKSLQKDYPGLYDEFKEIKKSTKWEVTKAEVKE